MIGVPTVTDIELFSFTSIKECVLFDCGVTKSLFSFVVLVSSDAFDFEEISKFDEKLVSFNAASNWFFLVSKSLSDGEFTGDNSMISP